MSHKLCHRVVPIFLGQSFSNTPAVGFRTVLADFPFAFEMIDRNLDSGNRLQKDLSAQFLVQQARGHHWRAMGRPLRSAWLGHNEVGKLRWVIELFLSEITRARESWCQSRMSVRGRAAVGQRSSLAVPGRSCRKS